MLHAPGAARGPFGGEPLHVVHSSNEVRGVGIVIVIVLALFWWVCDWWIVMI